MAMGTLSLLGLLTGGAQANISLVPSSGKLVLDADTVGANASLLSSDVSAPSIAAIASWTSTSSRSRNTRDTIFHRLLSATK